jgi:hypothetical protein
MPVDQPIVLIDDTRDQIPYRVNHPRQHSDLLFWVDARIPCIALQRMNRDFFDLKAQ